MKLSSHLGAPIETSYIKITLAYALSLKKSEFYQI